MPVSAWSWRGRKSGTRILSGAPRSWSGLPRAASIAGASSGCQPLVSAQISGFSRSGRLRQRVSPPLGAARSWPLRHLPAELVDPSAARCGYAFKPSAQLRAPLQHHCRALRSSAPHVAGLLFLALPARVNNRIRNRRFHAQTTGCHACGPAVRQVERAPCSAVIASAAAQPAATSSGGGAQAGQPVVWAVRRGFGGSVYSPRRQRREKGGQRRVAPLERQGSARCLIGGRRSGAQAGEGHSAAAAEGNRTSSPGRWRRGQIGGHQSGGDLTRCGGGRIGRQLIWPERASRLAPTACFPAHRGRLVGRRVQICGGAPRKDASAAFPPPPASRRHRMGCSPTPAPQRQGAGQGGDTNERKPTPLHSLRPQARKAPAAGGVFMCRWWLAVHQGVKADAHCGRSYRSRRLPGAHRAQVGAVGPRRDREPTASAISTFVDHPTSADLNRAGI